MLILLNRSLYEGLSVFLKNGWFRNKAFVTIVEYNRNVPQMRFVK